MSKSKVKSSKTPKLKGPKRQKLKGLVVFKLDQVQHIMLAGEDLKNAVVQNVDGGKEVKWAWTQLPGADKRVHIKGTPSCRSRKRGDLFGDLTVTLVPGTAPDDSVTMTNIGYE